MNSKLCDKGSAFLGKGELISGLKQVIGPKGILWSLVLKSHYFSRGGGE